MYHNSAFLIHGPFILPWLAVRPPSRCRVRQLPARIRAAQPPRQPQHLSVQARGARNKAAVASAPALPTERTCRCRPLGTSAGRQTRRRRAAANAAQARLRSSRRAPARRVCLSPCARGHVTWPLLAALLCVERLRQLVCGRAMLVACAFARWSLRDRALRAGCSRRPLLGRGEAAMREESTLGQSWRWRRLGLV